MNQIIALHGFTGQGADFTSLREALPADVALVAPDLPGHGSRRSLRSLADYSLAAHLDLISAAATTPQITLLGYSMGARLALHWAIAHPERIRRLILIGASPGLATPEERDERRHADATLAEFIRTRGLEAFFKYWHNQTFFQPLMRLPKDRLAPILARRAQNDPEGLALSLENVGTGTLPSLWPRLKEIRFPVDLVTGEHDTKFTRLAHEMGAHLAKARHSLVEGAGHAVHLERPDDIAALVQA
jgi:2-succinyl-6-hydroxy-2,4-cyclohexadiene-1-carboxylate synthase